MRKTRATAVAFALACAASCAEREVVRAPLDGEDLPLAFVVVTGAGGDPTRVSGVFSVAGGRVAFGALPAIELGGGETAAVLVAIPAGALARTLPLYAGAREQEIEVVVGAPPPLDAPRVREDGASPAAEMALPEGTTFRALAQGSLQEVETQLASKLVLDVPLDLERCRVPGRDRMTLFAQIPGDAPSGDRGAERVIRLDADRVLYLGARTAYVLRRGAGPPQSAIPLATLPGGSSSVAGLGMAIASGPDPRRVLISARSGDLGYLWDFEVDAAGLRFVATSSVPGYGGRHQEPLPRIQDVAIDAAGASVVVGESGFVAVRGPDAPTFRRATSLTAGSLVRRVLATRIAERPHLAANDIAELWLGNASSGAWDKESVSEAGLSIHFFALAADAALAELWAGGADGHLDRRLGGGRWTRVVPELPPRFWGCASAVAPGSPRRVQSAIQAIGIDRLHAYVVPEDCNAVLRLRRADLCASVITRDGEPVGPVEDDLRAADVRDGRLTVASRPGLVYELELE